MSAEKEKHNSAVIPIKLAPITGRVSRAKKGVPVHTCDLCKPPKTFTRAEHLRRHQLSHQIPGYPCTWLGCDRTFHRPDLLARHEQRHAEEASSSTINNPREATYLDPTSINFGVHNHDADLSLKSSPKENGAPWSGPNQATPPILDSPEGSLHPYRSGSGGEPSYIVTNLGHHPTIEIERKANLNVLTNPQSQTVYSSEAFTDSGYASHGRSLKNRIAQDITQDARDPSVGTAYSKGQTVYSDTPSIQDANLALHIVELAEEIASVLPRSVPVDQLNDLSAVLPSLLKEFSHKLAKDNPDRLRTRLSYLVHRYRTEISNAVIKTFGINEPDEDDTSEDKPSMGSDSMSMADKMALWQSKEHGPERDVASPELWDDGMDIDDAFEIFPELQEYSDMLLRSSAFTWLLNSVQNQVKLEIPGHRRAQLEIRQKILGSFDEPERISRKDASAKRNHTIIFDISWLWDFFVAQEYDVSASEALGQVLVLTGMPCNSWATSCSQYVNTIWPDTGADVLGVFEALLRNGPDSRAESTLFDGTTLLAFAKATDKKVLVQAHGSAYSIAEIAEIVGWINAALGITPPDGKIAHVYPSCEITTQPLGSIPEKVCQLGMIGESIGIDYAPTNRNGTCWMSLFRNPVMVRGFPIPRREQPNTGIEISLKIMTQLLNSRKLSTFENKIMIKSFSAFAIPSGKEGSITYWHAITNYAGEHCSYTDGDVKKYLRDYPDNLQVGDLETSRHILGWCPNVKNCAGTSDADYNIGWSGLQRPRPGCAFEKVSIAGGMFVTGGVSCISGKKDKAVHLHHRDDYIMRLKWISKKFVMLYDVHDRRAWLVDGVTALLHLVRASLKHDQQDPFNSLFLYNDTLLQESRNTGSGKIASIFMLTDKHNINLPLYAKPETAKEEVIISEEGTRSGFVSKTQLSYSFRERVDNICDIMEKIIAHQTDASTEDGVGFRIKYTMRRQLEGFDFMDVATDEEPIWPRITTLKATGRGWVDFTRAIHAVTLFGSGFGDLFRPVAEATRGCKSCLIDSEVPKGQDYLAVCISDVQNVLQKRGNTSQNPWRLVDEIYWHNPDKIFEPCECGSWPPNKHDRVQVLIPSTFRNLWSRQLKSPANLKDTPQGAVLFGHSRRFPLRWKDHGVPEEGQLEQETVEDVETLSFHDSGIGLTSSSSCT